MALVLLSEEQTREHFRRWMGKRTQREVAQELGVSSQRVSDWLRGRRRMGNDTLARIGLRRKTLYERV